MRILGIGDHVSCGSALVEDGKLVAYAIKRHHCDHTTGADRKKIVQTAKSQTARVERQNVLQMAKVEHVIDGDTVIVSSSWRKNRILEYIQ